MDRVSFKRHHRSYFGHLKEGWKKMREDYHISIMDCPISDEEETLMQFFDGLTEEEIEGYEVMDDCKMVCIDDCIPVPKNWFKLAPLPPAVPAPCSKDFWSKGCKKQEGNKPMRYNDNYASATAAITNPKSDIAVQREYFTRRLRETSYPKEAELAKQFNLHVDNSPKTFQQLIDAIKGGKYTVDKKVQAKFDDLTDKGQWYYGNMYGFIWDGPQRDYKGYELALTEKNKQYTTAEDTIMSGDAAAMKAAVEAFEAWTPTATTTAN